MNSALFKINWRDLVNGLIVAVGGSVLMFILDLIKTPGFDFYSIPWSEIGRIALLSFGGYIAKKFFSTSDGKVFGVIK